MMKWYTGKNMENFYLQILSAGTETCMSAVDFIFMHLQLDYFGHFFQILQMMSDIL